MANKITTTPLITMAEILNENTTIQLQLPSIYSEIHDTNESMVVSKVVSATEIKDLNAQMMVSSVGAKAEIKDTNLQLQINPLWVSELENKNIEVRLYPIIMAEISVEEYHKPNQFIKFGNIAIPIYKGLKSNKKSFDTMGVAIPISSSDDSWLIL